MCYKFHKKGHLARVCKSKGWNKASWVDVGEEDEDLGSLNTLLCRCEVGSSEQFTVKVKVNNTIKDFKGYKT